MREIKHMGKYAIRLEIQMISIYGLYLVFLSTALGIPVMSAQATIFVLLYLFSVVTMVAVSSSVLTMGISMGGRRTGVFNAMQIVKIAVALINGLLLICLELIPAFTISTGQVITFLCVSVLIGSVGELTGLLMNRYGRKVMIIYMVVITLLSGLAGAVSVGRGVHGATWAMSYIQFFLDNAYVICAAVLLLTVGVTLFSRKMIMHYVVKG